MRRQIAVAVAIKGLFPDVIYGYIDCQEEEALPGGKCAEPVLWCSLVRNQIGDHGGEEHGESADGDGGTATAAYGAPNRAKIRFIRSRKVIPVRLRLAADTIRLTTRSSLGLSAASRKFGDFRQCVEGACLTARDLEFYCSLALQ
ncbi:unnamed protein product [Heligmosomoides polygyrus]|uniref:Uncharacterized protein n=1 Tax=Heligmosomoides polygyrus TaxID=6339 RepID=A0A183GRT2_HELPZ|nr:unnamed protein product [Heligmosomoides polygyrus]